MTQKLYYNDSYLTSCKAIVQDQKNTQDGLWLAFDQTVFYPGGGGQLADKGMINHQPVLDVKVEDDRIWHQVQPANEEDWSGVQMQIDWSWRYYNMQQHSGQHLLSHLLWERQLKTVSVHLGESYTLIEVEGATPQIDQLQQIEARVNEKIRQAVPIRAYWVERDAVQNLPLRKPAGEWTKLRVVEIEGQDYSACGGTHVNNTSEIGLIKYISMEKIRGHFRLKYKIGQTAYDYLNTLHSLTRELMDKLHTDPEQFAVKLASLENELVARKKLGNFYRRYYIDFKSQEIGQTAKEPGGVIVFTAEEGTFDDWKEIAQSLVKGCGQAVFIFIEQRFMLLIPENIKLDGAGFLKTYGQRLGLRGGGPADFVQGMATQRDPELVRKCLLDAIKQS